MDPPTPKPPFFAAAPDIRQRPQPQPQPVAQRPIRDRYGRVYEAIPFEVGSQLQFNADRKVGEESGGKPRSPDPVPERVRQRQPPAAPVSGPSTASAASKASKALQRLRKWRPAPALVKEFGKCFDDERLRRDTVIIRELEIKDNNLIVATPTVGASLVGFATCSNCKTFAKPPIWSCNAGHIICGYCTEFEDVSSCPRLLPGPGGPHGALKKLCGTPISPCRLELYTHYYNTNIFHCPYKESGCEEKYPGTAIDSHINNCEFRPSVRCPCSFCDVGMVEPRHFFKHLGDGEGCHGTPTFKGNAKVVRVMHERKTVLPVLNREFRWIGAHFRAGKLDFLLVVQETREDICFWIQLYSTSHLLKDRVFICRLRLRTPGNAKLFHDHEWCGPVLRAEVDMDTLSKEDSCFVVRRSEFEKYFLFKEPEDVDWFFNMDVLIDQLVLNVVPAAAGGDGPAPRRDDKARRIEGALKKMKKPSYRLQD